MNKGTKVMESSNNTQTTSFEGLEASPFSYGAVVFNKERFLQVLGEINNMGDLSLLKNKIVNLKGIVKFPKNDREGLLNIDTNGDTVSLRRDVLVSELDQILEAQIICLD